MIKKITFSLLLILLGSSTTLFADEQQSKRELSPTIIHQLDLINHLVALGELNKDPVLLIAAAKLKKNLSDKKIPLSSHSLSTKDILKQAERFSQGRKDILGLIEDARTMKSKSVCMGGLRGSDCTNIGIMPKLLQ